MKFFFYFLIVIFATIFVNVNGTSPPKISIPSPDLNLPLDGVDACDQPNKLGRTTSRQTFTRYYYNKDARECKAFIFGGGPATANNFETKEACKIRCMGLTSTVSGDSSSTITTPRTTTISNGDSSSTIKPPKFLGKKFVQ